MSDGSILSDDECANGVTFLAGRGRRRRCQEDGRSRQKESGEEGGDEDHGWAAIRAMAKESGRSSNGGGARVAGCLGGDPGDVETATTWM